MPSFSADYFGTRHMGANYGALLTAWGVAGVVGPLFAAYAKDVSGSFGGVLPVVASVLLMATILPLTTRKPDVAKRFARQHASPMASAAHWRR